MIGALLASVGVATVLSTSPPPDLGCTPVPTRVVRVFAELEHSWTATITGDLEEAYGRAFARATIPWLFSKSRLIPIEDCPIACCDSVVDAGILSSQQSSGRIQTFPGTATAGASAGEARVDDLNPQNDAVMASGLANCGAFGGGWQTTARGRSGQLNFVAVCDEDPCARVSILNTPFAQAFEFPEWIFGSGPFNVSLSTTTQAALGGEFESGGSSGGGETLYDGRLFLGAVHVRSTLSVPGGASASTAGLVALVSDGTTISAVRLGIFADSGFSLATTATTFDFAWTGSGTPQFPLTLSGSGPATVEGSFSSTSVQSLRGDVNGDNIICPTDRALIIAALGATFSSPSYLLQADLNVDGTINATDLSLFDNSPSCRPDLNCDGELTFDDTTLFTSYYNTEDLRADFNDDGEVTFDDLQLYLQLYSAGC
jgi:hypothetical protein